MHTRLSTASQRSLWLWGCLAGVWPISVAAVLDTEWKLPAAFPHLKSSVCLFPPRQGRAVTALYPHSQPSSHPCGDGVPSLSPDVHPVDSFLPTVPLPLLLAIAFQSRSAGVEGTSAWHVTDLCLSDGAAGFFCPFFLTDAGHFCFGP